MNVTLEQIRRFIDRGEQPDEFIFVHVFGTELTRAVSHAPKKEHKRPYIRRELETLLSGVDWNTSFDRPLVIVYDETLLSEILIELHWWLRIQGGNIENVYLVNTHGVGITQWWKSWCDVMREKSFNIIDGQPSPVLIDRYLSDTPNRDIKDLIDERMIHLEQVFSYYGGTYGTLERDYLFLQLTEFDEIAMLDYCATVSQKPSILAYAEEISFYQDQATVDVISQAYDHVVDSAGRCIKNQSIETLSRPMIKNEPMDYQGRQWETDRMCFATVVRETLNNEPYPIVTEKTWRGFLYGMMVIPLGFQSVELLEQQGFWFPHDLFDYDYQYHHTLHSRMCHVKQSIRSFSKSYTVRQLKEYIKINVEKFAQNQKLVYQNKRGYGV